MKNSNEAIYRITETKLSLTNKFMWNKKRNTVSLFGEQKNGHIDETGNCENHFFLDSEIVVLSYCSYVNYSIVIS